MRQSSARRRLAYLIALSLVVALLVPTGRANAVGLPQSDQSAWLGEVNTYRSAAGLLPVTDQPQWDTGLIAHFDYLDNTPYSYMTGAYASAHTENPSSPYYTAAGALEGGRSDLYLGAWGMTPTEVIDGWLAAPFHAIGMLRRQLTQVAYAAKGRDAGLDVIGGLSGTATGPENVLFPGPGMSTNLTTYGLESPSPLETCGWQNSYTPVGLPLIALLSTTPDQNLTATLTSSGGQNFSTADASLCVVDENNYRSSDPVYGPTGLSILKSDHAVLLIPKTPLTWGRFEATINQPNKPAIDWSFIAAPGHQLDAWQTYTLHVASPGTATTVLGNLTVTEPATSGYVTAYPCGQTRPTASNINFLQDQTVANFAAIQTNTNGDICFFTTTSTQIIWDQVSETSTPTTHNPTRLLDTRVTHDPPASWQTYTLHVASPGTATTVLGNLTVTEPATSGYVTAYPCGQTRPTASNINFLQDQTVANFAAIQTNTNGDICFFTTTSTQIIWDQVSETSTPTTHNPTRLLDTRNPGPALP